MKELIQTRPNLDRVIKELDSRNLFSLDTETNGFFGIYEVAMVGLSLGWEDYACYIPLQHLKGRQLPIELVLDKLKPILEDPSKDKIYHNAVFDEVVLSRYDIDIQGIPHDTAVMAHLYNENYWTKKLKILVEDYLGYKMQTYEDVVEAAPLKRGQKPDYNFARVKIEDALPYAADDALQTWNLFQFLKSKLEEEKVWGAYLNIEGPLQRVVRKMKEAGVTVDLAAIKHADEVFPRLMEEIEKDVYKEAGEVFNIGSGQQLGKMLFDNLGIGNNVPRTKSGQYSTDKKVLKLYSSRYKVVENVLRRKKIQKTHSTFVKGLEKFILKDGKVHAEFNTVGTDTGRFSSSKPNLQNQEGDEVEDIKVRSFFIPSEGYKMWVADYSQIELRLLAHFSRDENMTAAFLSGRDFHDETARKMLEIQGLGITADVEVTPRQRFNAKSLNFGIPYGRGDGSVAEMLGCPRKCAHWPTWNPKLKIWEFIVPETKEIIAWSDKKIKNSDYPVCHNCGACFIRDWYDAFPRVEPYKESVLQFTRDHEYVRTLSGRKRRLTEINSKVFTKRSHAERQAFNTKIQGSAGDILKLAMVKLSPELDKLGTRILMTVHDELVGEALEARAEDTVAIVKEVMENPFSGDYPLRLPMVVKPAICDRWSDGK